MGMAPFGRTSRQNRLALALLVAMFALLALEIWGIRSSLANLLR
jgi:hypothetical protein